MTIRLSIFRGAPALLLVTALSACTSTREIGGDPQLEVLQATELPMPESVDSSGQERWQRLGPLDKLTIEVVGLPEPILREVQVDSGGRVSFPVAGGIDVMGKSPTEVEEILEQRLRAKYVRDPQAIVNLQESLSQTVTVEGEVSEPGVYPVTGQMTLLKAMAVAKGPDEFASIDDVVVFRTVGAQRYAALYNLEAIRRGVYRDPPIIAHDTIVVGESSARRLFKDILQGIPLLTAPLVILTR